MTPTSPYQGSPAAFRVVVERSVRISLGDGVGLVADLYRPSRDGVEPMEGAFPTVLEATPYDRKRLDLVMMGRFFAARGYVVALVDSRGRNESEGEFSFFFADPHEGHDMAQVIGWIAGQGWSDGCVGTTGLSFCGNNQQAAAILKPPNLKTVIVMDAGYNYWSRTFRSAGAFSQGLLLPYAFWMALGGKEAEADPRARRVLEDGLRDVDTWLGRAPLKAGASPLAAAPSYERWYLAMQETREFEAMWRNPMTWIEGAMEEWSDIPTLLLTSWYGHHAVANIEKWRKLAVPSRSAPVHLRIGTWLHAFNYTDQSISGDVDFGSAAALHQDDLRLRWFDRFLKGHRTGSDEEPPITVFVQGGGSGKRRLSGRFDHGGSWRGKDGWPETSDELVLALTPDRRLASDDAPPSSEPTRYLFDPRSPVPTIGGSFQNPIGQSGRSYMAGGACDQRGRADLVTCRDTLPLASRNDIRVFRSDPLDRDVEVVGNVLVELWVSTTGPDADFTAKLIDEYPPSADYPEGYALNLCDAILRLSRRDGGTCQPVRNGEVYRVTIGPMATGNRFAAGHRIRLDVSSSNWPLYDLACDVPCHNAIHHDRSPPCALRLEIPVQGGESPQGTAQTGNPAIPTRRER